MHELWPDPNSDVDLGARMAEDLRPPLDDRPWVTMIMIESLDGQIAVAGASGALGGPADREWFVAARRQADAIVVGATTATVENYQPTTVPIAVISGSLAVDPEAALFGKQPNVDEPANSPLLYTVSATALDRGQIFDGIAEVIDLGDSIDPAAVLADLRQRDFSRVLLEGGPTLNGLFLEADLVDEVLLTLSPVIVGGNGPSLARTDLLATPHRYSLDRVSVADDLLFLRYLRTR